MRKALNRLNWWGLRCLTRWCPGFIDSDEIGVYWQCSLCGRRDYAHETWWDWLPPDGPRKGPFQG